MNVLRATPPDRIDALHAIRDRHTGHSTANQRSRLLEALRTMGHVTTFEAMRYLDLYDPRPRKLELVRLGFDVVMVWRYAETESRKLHRIGVYSLRGEVSRAA